MQIMDFTLEHIAVAELLARENYQEEKEIVGCLPESGEPPGLSELAGNGLGVAAVEGSRLLDMSGERSVRLPKDQGNANLSGQTSGGECLQIVIC